MLYWSEQITGKKSEIHTTKFAITTTKSIVYPYYGNIQLLWITKIHSISNKGPYNFHSMTFYGFSIFFPVNDTKLHVFATKHKANTYSEQLIHSDDCVSI
jgi:hypothetical protein